MVYISLNCTKNVVICRLVLIDNTLSTCYNFNISRIMSATNISKEKSYELQNFKD